MTTTARLHSRIAIRTRWYGADDPEVLAARRELRTLLATNFLRKLVAEHPPLLPEQLERIAEAVHDGSNR